MYVTNISLSAIIHIRKDRVRGAGGPGPRGEVEAGGPAVRV